MDWKDPEAVRAYYKAYYEANRERVAANQKKYRDANKEKLAAYRKQTCEKRRDYSKSWTLANKDKRAASRKRNREKIAAYAKVYNEVNREKMNKLQSAWKKTKLGIKTWYRYKHGIEIPDQLVELIIINREIKRAIREKHQ